MISLHILAKRFFLKRKRFSDVSVVSTTKEEYGFSEQFLKDT